MNKKKRITDNIENLINLSEYNLSKNRFAKRKDAGKKYLKEVIEGTEESLDEYKKNNKVYLEDELGDIFWDYLQALKILERDNYINSVEEVF